MGCLRAGHRDVYGLDIGMSTGGRPDISHYLGIGGCYGGIGKSGDGIGGFRDGIGNKKHNNFHPSGLRQFLGPIRQDI